MHVFTDWEGPWILTDIAYELSLAAFNNGEFFERLSQYDDYLAYVEKKEGYQAGDTLKLLAPFLVAADLSLEELEVLSEQTARFVPDAEKAMEYLQERVKPVVISTSYDIYLTKTARMIGVRGDLHGTVFDPEKYRIDAEWKRWLLVKVDEIASLEDIEISEGKTASAEYLNSLFWKELPKTPFWQIMEDVKVVGSRRKREIAESYNESKVITIGDSISDIEMFDYARENDGLAMSFNGNEFALRHANLAVIADSAVVEAVIAITFLERGFEGVREIAESGHDLLSGKYEIHFEIDEDTIRKSLKMRRALRGKAGELG
ncbi:hypothetical protein [Geoglobus acetivorans]|uniref:Haloacid dehalogenase-like hydrolase n=1 Tax=Geoglobus acetivorans TaxID=565033 RepID=A0ABZ3H211_GEOAI|nr:hypothetical protein [Geoglobus acetivorans]